MAMTIYLEVVQLEGKYYAFRRLDEPYDEKEAGFVFQVSFKDNGTGTSMLARVNEMARRAARKRGVTTPIIHLDGN